MSPYIEHAASGLPNPTLGGGWGTICPGSRPAGYLPHVCQVKFTDASDARLDNPPTLTLTCPLRPSKRRPAVTFSE